MIRTPALGTMQVLPTGSLMASRQQELGFQIAEVAVRIEVAQQRPSARIGLPRRW